MAETLVVNKIKGISQNHWTTRLQILLNANDQLQHGYETMLEHLKQLGGVLQDYSPPSCDYLPELITPVKDWRSTVRTAIADREVQKFRVAAGKQQTLQVLECSTDNSLKKAVNLSRRSSHRANWIRVRLLTGTSSLNGMMARITDGKRSHRCPVCDNGPETVAHFLRTCRAQSSIVARLRHRNGVTRSFEDLTELQQCAFILGCVVKVGSKELAASTQEDLANLMLVESLWDTRCTSLSAALDLTENINIVRQRHPGARGVEAYGIATLSN